MGAEQLFDLGHEAVELADFEVAVNRALSKFSSDDDNFTRPIAVDLFDDARQRPIPKDQQSGLPRGHLGGIDARGDPNACTRVGDLLTLADPGGLAGVRNIDAPSRQVTETTPSRHRASKFALAAAIRPSAASITSDADAGRCALTSTSLEISSMVGCPCSDAASQTRNRSSRRSLCTQYHYAIRPGNLTHPIRLSADRLPDGIP